MLTTDIARKGRTTIVRCAGRIVVGKELSKLRDTVLCELNKQTIVLDLAAVEAIDAGGLGLLVFLHTCAHALGTELKLGARSAQVENALRLTKLDAVLRLCSEAEIDSYFAPRFGDEQWETTKSKLRKPTALGSVLHSLPSGNDSTECNQEFPLM